MYTSINFKSKKELKLAVAEGRRVTIFQPGGLFPTPTDGRVALEGPHYPQPHKWYAGAIVKDGIVIKVE